MSEEDEKPGPTTQVITVEPATPPRGYGELVEQARWRTSMAEQRSGSVRSQLTAILAVIAVVGGIGATAIGTLGSRNLSSLSFRLEPLHTVPGEVVLLVPLALSALFVLASAAIVLSALQDRSDVSSQETSERIAGYRDLVGHDQDHVASQLLLELSFDYLRVENGANIGRRGLTRASWLLGVGVALGIAASAILIASKGNPTQTQLVKSPQLKASPLEVRMRQ